MGEGDEEETAPSGSGADSGSMFTFSCRLDGLNASSSDLFPESSREISNLGRSNISAITVRTRLTNGSTASVTATSKAITVYIRTSATLARAFTTPRICKKNDLIVVITRRFLTEKFANPLWTA